MGRKCKVCIHSEYNDINKMLVAGVKYRNITEQFSLTKQSLCRHKKLHIPKEIIKSKQAQEIADADTVISELKAYKMRIVKLFNACDEWLTDPDDPDRYTLDPRTDEIDVIYIEVNTRGREIHRRIPLNLLLKKTGKVIDHWEFKRADPRELILKTANSLNKQLELLATLTGELEKSIKIKIETSPEWIQIRETILQVLDPYPDIKTKMVRAFEENLINANN